MYAEIMDLEKVYDRADRDAHWEVLCTCGKKAARSSERYLSKESEA